MTIRTFSIQGRRVGEGQSCFLIAEMGLGHDGSLGAAHAFIDALSGAGADAVKFQTHIAAAEGTREETFRVPVFPQDASRQGYWKRTAFTKEQWLGLKKHADEKEVIFLSTPFSSEAMHLLAEVGMPAWKVASGEANNYPLLGEMARTKLPILLSTGLSGFEEIDRAVETVQNEGAPLLLYQTASHYPCPPERLGLNLIGQYRERYGVPIGYSDHSGRTATGIAAFSLGASSLEVHVTFSRKCFGPDVQASLTVEEFGSLADGIRFLEKAFLSPLDKEEEVERLEEMRLLFTKSIVAGRDIAEGSRLTMEDLDFKKPGRGIAPGEAGRVVGRRALRPLGKDDILAWDDLGE